MTISGQSDLVDLDANIANGFSPFSLGAVTQIPTSLTLSSSFAALTQAGATTQVSVLAKYPDNSTSNVTSPSTGTSYTISNPAIATVSGEGVVTAVSSGTVFVSATNDGAIGMLQLRVLLAGLDTDGDGIPDDIEVTNGLNPNDLVDGREDPDGDGLTNFAELVTHGTNRLLADTDTDGISDGDEIGGALGTPTNPLLADTDSDGIRDLLEIQTGSNPTDGSSFNLAQALESFDVTPPSFVLTVNTIIGEASRQLAVTGNLRDGTTIDLTSTARGTSYSSSDLFVVNFGSPDGRVFAGQDGTATVTVANNGFSKEVAITVRSTTPTPLSFVTIPGTANNVDVNGDFAYVAAGAAGLQVVNVSNRLAPVVVGSLDTPGNAQDVRIFGNFAYVADGSSGLRIINVTVPTAPVAAGSVDTPGDAQDVVVAGNRAYVADGTSGLQIIDISSPALPRIIAGLDTLGTTAGVDVAGNLAVLADGGAGIQVVNVADPEQPNIIGSLSYGGDARDVAVQGSYAFIADRSTSLTPIDLTDPASPVRRTSTPQSTGGLLEDVAIAGRFAFGADIFFVNGVPIIDIANPATPTPRSILNFESFRDDDGTGIAVDSSYVYMTGTLSDSRLYIGQYQSIEDTRGIAPQVAITSPAPGTALVEGETIVVQVQASDDVEVASVTLSANGTLLGTDTVAPYEFGLTVPTGLFAMNLTAQAVDFGANSATSAPVLVDIIPDPLTTVTGRVVDSDGNPVAAAEVSAFGSTPVGTNSDGTFSISNVPTIRGSIIANASATVGSVLLTGSSASKAPVRGGVTAAGDITVIEANFETQYGASLASCDDCWVEVDLPFPFTYFGVTYQRAFFDGNGRVSFGFGSGDYRESIAGLSEQPIVSALWNDWDASGIPGSGIYYNGGLPGRAVFTWLTIPSYPSGESKPRVTFQIILFEDGRVQFGYNGIAVPVGVTGISAGPGSVLQVVNFGDQTSFSVAGSSTVAQDFQGNFNLDHNFITWTPNAAAGFDVRVFATPAPAPVMAAARALVPDASSAFVKPSTIQFHSRLGRVYLLQVNPTTHFNERNWETIGTPIIGTGEEMEVSLPATPPNGAELVHRVIPAPGGENGPSELAAEAAWQRSVRIAPENAAAAIEGGTAARGVVPPGGMQVSFPTTAGSLYRVECSEDLSAGTWTSMGETITGTGKPISISDPIIPGRPRCFYRVVKVGPAAR